MDAPKLVLIGDTLLALYEQMVEIRQVELRLGRSHAEGRFEQSLSLAKGQEAVSVGMCHHLTPADGLFCSHRATGHLLAKGVSSRQLLAAYYGDCSEQPRRVLENSGELSIGPVFPKVGVWGIWSKPGSALLRAVGAAVGYKTRGEGTVAVAIFGEAGVLDGAFYEAINVAALWQLPLVIVCVKNQHLGETRFESLCSHPKIVARSKQFGMPAYGVDGNDVSDVYGAAHEAIRKARAGEGATLIVCRTFRLSPMREGQPNESPYDDDEVEQWKERDPLQLLAEQLVETEIASPEQLQQIHSDVAREVQQAHQAACGESEAGGSKTEPKLQLSGLRLPDPDSKDAS